MSEVLTYLVRIRDHNGTEHGLGVDIDESVLEKPSVKATMVRDRMDRADALEQLALNADQVDPRASPPMERGSDRRPGGQAIDPRGSRAARATSLVKERSCPFTRTRN